jgi:hypothetical protein
MKNRDISRRGLLKGGGALAGLTVTQVTGPTKLFGQAGEQVLPWLDQPAPSPSPSNFGNNLKWEEVNCWDRTPTRLL